MKSGFQAPGTQDCLSSACYLHITSQQLWRNEQIYVRISITVIETASFPQVDFCNNNTSKGEFCDLPLFYFAIHSTGQDKLHPTVSLGNPQA